MAVTLRINDYWAERANKARSAKGWTKDDQQLISSSGAARSTLARFWRGEGIQKDKIENIFTALGMDFSAFLQSVQLEAADSDLISSMITPISQLIEKGKKDLKSILYPDKRNGGIEFSEHDSPVIALAVKHAHEQMTRLSSTSIERDELYKLLTQLALSPKGLTSQPWTHLETERQIPSQLLDLLLDHGILQLPVSSNGLRQTLRGTPFSSYEFSPHLQSYFAALGIGSHGLTSTTERGSSHRNIELLDPKEFFLAPESNPTTPHPIASPQIEQILMHWLQIDPKEKLPTIQSMIQRLLSQEMPIYADSPINKSNASPLLSRIFQYTDLSFMFQDLMSGIISPQEYKEKRTIALKNNKPKFTYLEEQQ